MLSTLTLAFIAGVTDNAHIIRGAGTAILEGDDMGYIYLSHLSPVAVAGVTYATAAELAPVVVAVANHILKGRMLPVGLAASNGHS